MNEISLTAWRTYLAQISLQGTPQSATDKRFLSYGSADIKTKKNPKNGRQVVFESNTTQLKDIRLTRSLPYPIKCC